ncbi:hypothetical protein CXB51_028027 [Gossypium anomalum]|uniref:DUF7745 domain-containing protein n=1 Tax=Gossypium anomalum TaxID=47600 RepID=A0A8J5YA30_9ROSI|nr:hypothetical protein CXB51_028027 [Gossypium anomalum]
MVRIEESAGSESFVMGNEYLDKVEDNASNEFQELRDIWAQWDDEAKQLFYQNYRDLPYLLDVKVDRHLFRAMVQFWNPAYCCFTFVDVDLVPTLEEYTALLRCPRILGYKAYVRPASLPTFTKKLIMITGMSEQWAIARVQQKGNSKCILWAVLRDLILTHPDVKKRVDVLALSIYGLVIFPKALGHIDETVTDLFDRLGKQNTLVPVILAEMFRSLSACRRANEGRGEVDRYSSESSRERCHVELVPSEVLYYCGSFDWVPLPGIWGVVGYAPLLVLRQYRARQFIPATQGLAQSDFSYKRDHYKKRMREIYEAWKKPFCMKILTEGSTSTLEYKGWFSRKINDNVPRPILGVARSLEESLRVIPSELEREVEKVKKEKRKIKKNLDDLKTYYKKAQVTLKRVGLGRSSKQWQQEIQEEMVKTEYWEKKFQEIQSHNQALKKENQALKTKVAELGRSLHHHRSRNSVIEVKASLDKIEEMKHNIGRLEAALQDCELRIEQLEARE